MLPVMKSDGLQMGMGNRWMESGGGLESSV